MSDFYNSRVMIVESNRLLLENYSQLVQLHTNLTLAGAFEETVEALKAIPRLKPAIILMDIESPSQTGFEFIRRVKQEFPAISILVATSYKEREFVFAALKAGASGYIIKSSNYLEIVSSLEEIYHGGAPLSRDVAKVIVGSFHTNFNSPLSRREVEVLNYLAQGKTYSQISTKMLIAKDTARTHIRNIYVKLNVKCKSEALEYASKYQLLDIR